MHSAGGHLSEINISGQKSSFQQGQAPCGGPNGESVPCLFQLLVAACVPWMNRLPTVVVPLHPLPSWSHCLLLFVCVRASPALIL